jgi:hypothetical protein
MASATAFSPADVAAAISRYLGVDVNREEVRSIASRVSLQGIRLPAGSDLARSGDFHNRVLAAGGEELTRLVDPQKLERLRREADNRGTLPYVRVIHGQVVFGDHWLPPVLATREPEDGGNSYVALANPDLTASPQMASMLRHADRCGLGWLRQNRELLQLGPGAIQTLVEARFRRESFQRLRNAGYNRQDAADLAVNIARHANRTGQDANRIARSVEENVRIFGGRSEEERRRWREMLKRFYADHPAARDELDRALTDMETRGTPAQREQARRQRELMRRREEARAERTRTITDVGRDTATADRERTVTVTETTAARAEREARQARERAEAAARAEAARREAARRRTVAAAEDDILGTTAAPAPGQPPAPTTVTDNRPIPPIVTTSPAPS